MNSDVGLVGICLLILSLSFLIIYRFIWRQSVKDVCDFALQLFLR